MKTKHILITILLIIITSNKVFSLVFYGGYSIIPFAVGPTFCGVTQNVAVTFNTTVEVGMKKYRVIRSLSSTNHSGTVINSSGGGGGWVNACGTCTNKSYTIIDSDVLPPGVYHYWVNALSGGLFGGYSWHYLGSLTIPIAQSVDWTSQVAGWVNTGSTPTNSSAYVWHEETKIKQGVQISLLANDVADIYIEQNNSIIAFNTFFNNFFIDLKVNIDNQGWVTLYNGGSKLSYVWQNSSAFFSLGDHVLNVRWVHSPSAQIYSRTYNIHVVPKSTKLFKDNYCNTLRLWEGNIANDAVPIVISEGFDAYNTTPSQFIAYAGNDLMNCLKNAGFKIYILNYSLNSQDMRRNAAVYSAAIKYVSAINNNKPVVAGGISMGGVIARYATAKAEDIGSPLPISKFVTIDSPHQGAVISEALQDYLKSNSSTSYTQHGLNNLAAKQLLTYNTYIGNGSVKTAFYNELNNLNGDGYPHNVESVGVTFSTSSPNPYSGKWLEIRVSGLANIYDFFNDKVQYDFDGYLSVEEQQSGSYLPRLTGSLAKHRPGPWSYFAMTKYKHPTFIPHNSSLDMVNGQSKFDVTIKPNVTGFHDEVPLDIIDPLINALVKENVYVQNKNITTNKYYIGKNIAAGNNVTTTLTAGNVVITNTANVVFHAANSIVLEPGFSTQTGSNFQAFIQPISCNIPQAQQYRFTDTIVNTKSVYDTTEFYVKTIYDSTDYLSLANNLALNIYPNPTNDKIFLNYLLNEQQQIVITVTDSKGQHLQKISSYKQQGFNTNEIDLKDYPKGIYFVRVLSKNEFITKQIVKL
ncbi:MAG: T9SS type A sorting domain-containing protein [Vicingaceae bacterium]|nr:T9SS type A sorting domain-containing protein [Vicingaceae bacterium]